MQRTDIKKAIIRGPIQLLLQYKYAIRLKLYKSSRITNILFKVENILEGSLDSIPSPSGKVKLWTVKFACGVKVKRCWALSTNF